MSEAAQQAVDTDAAIMEQLLRNPRSGPFMRWFIMTAIEEYAEKVIEMGNDGLKNPFVDPATWRACAEEAQQAMAAWQ
jgi:hypothetical protein